MHAYTGKILHIDLSTQKTWVEQKSPEFLKAYIGGVGLATRLLYDNTPAGCDALGPDNAICFACGAFVGTTIPSVSYTHLDVYKRQVAYACAELTEELRIV